MFPSRFAAKQVMGPPSVTAYGDNDKAWAQSSATELQEQYLQVSNFLSTTRYPQRDNCRFGCFF